MLAKVGIWEIDPEPLRSHFTVVLLKGSDQAVAVGACH